MWALHYISYLVYLSHVCACWILLVKYDSNLLPEFTAVVTIAANIEIASDSFIGVMFHPFFLNNDKRKYTDMDEAQILPDIQLPNENSFVTSRESDASFDNDEEKMIKPQREPEEMEIVPDIQVPGQITPSGEQLMAASCDAFSKTMTVPQVLQACQNYDFRYQRELLKSGVTLNLNPDDYLDQTISNEDAAFRLACAKYIKNYHANRRQQSQETEEQAITRRAQNALRMRNYRQSLRVVETDEQAAERRAQNALRMRNYRRFKRELEPDLAAERRAQNAERMRNYRKVKRELEPETAALRRAENALRMRNYRKKKRQEDPE